MVPIDKLEQIKARFEFLEASMAEGAAGDDFAALGREYAELRPVVEQIQAYQQLLEDATGAEEMLADPEMKELAEEELSDLRATMPKAEHPPLSKSAPELVATRRRCLSLI